MLLGLDYLKASKITSAGSLKSNKLGKTGSVFTRTLASTQLESIDDANNTKWI